MEEAENSWYIDGSSFVRQAVHKAGYTVTTASKVTESKSLTPNMFVQEAEIIALTQVLELAKGKRINIWMGSKYAFGVGHVHGALWKERMVLSTQGKGIKHTKEILRLLEAVQLPKEEVIMHYKVHQRGESLGSKDGSRGGSSGSTSPDSRE